MTKKYIIQDADKTKRCWWCGDLPIYVAYHDHEWGRPVMDDQRLFEKICLEGFQSGLSWITVLKKREEFRNVFNQFDFHKVARFGDKKIEQLLQNEGIIRHRGKIEATINNAARAIEMEKQFGSLQEFFWQFRPKKQLRFDPKRATTEESTEMSKRLKNLDGNSLGPQPVTPSCKRWAWSMIIIPNAMFGSKFKKCKSKSECAVGRPSDA